MIFCSSGTRFQRGSACIGKTIRDLQIRTATVRPSFQLLNPTAPNVSTRKQTRYLNEGATLILAGDRRTITQLKQLLVQGRVG